MFYTVFSSASIYIKNLQTILITTSITNADQRKTEPLCFIVAMPARALPKTSDFREKASENIKTTKPSFFSKLSAHFQQKQPFLFRSPSQPFFQNN